MAAEQVTTILHLIPTLEGGGAERQLSMLTIEQARRGYNVHVAVRRGGVYMQAMKDGGVKVHELGNFFSINPRLFLAIRRTLNCIKPEIVQTWLPQMDILGGLAAVQSRTAWIVSERTSKEYYAEVPLVARLRLFLGRFASAIVANSDGGAGYWRAGAHRPLKFATVRNAIDIKRIQEADPQAADSFGNPLFLAVGRFTREKASEVIVRAVSSLSGQGSINLIMIGEGAERPKIEAEIAAASLTERVTVLPYQSDWWRWLKVADGLISMSRYEGNPNVVLEAMAGGCPVILSDISAHREVADASTAIFVPVDDVRSLSKAIAELIANKEEAFRKASRASARMSSVTIESMTDAYDAVYIDVLKRKN